MTHDLSQEALDFIVSLCERNGKKDKEKSVIVHIKYCDWDKYN